MAFCLKACRNASAEYIPFNKANQSGHGSLRSSTSSNAVSPLDRVYFPENRAEELSVFLYSAALKTLLMSHHKGAGKAGLQFRYKLFH